MNKFEVVLLFSPDLTDNSINKEEDNFSSNIKSSKGKIVSTENWGLRDLTFNINNFKKAFYKFYQIEVDSSAIENFKKILSQNEKILRHLFVKVNEHVKLPTKMIKDEEK